MNNNHELALMHEPIGEEFLKLSHDSNPKIPYIVNCLELKDNQTYGRYVVTNKKLNPGEIIAIERPFSKCLLKYEVHKYCCNCLKDNCLDLFPCPDCTQAMFCSHKCYLQGVRKFHRFECSIVDALNDLCTKIMRIAAHTFFEALAVLDYDIRGLMSFMQEISDVSSTVFRYDLSNERMKRSHLLATIDALATNESDRNVADLFQRSGIVAILTHLFINYTKLGDVLATSESRDFFRAFIFKQTQIAVINYHGIFDGIMTKSQSSLCPQYASGSYPFCSLINHSCAPNLVRISHRCRNYVMVNRPIEAGEQLFDNYGHHHCIDNFEERQASLKQQYMFKCGCLACLNRFPLFSALPQVDTSFERFLGSDVAALADMNYETAKNRFRDYCKYIARIDRSYPCYEISCLQESILRCAFIFKTTPFKLKLLERD